VENNVVNVSDFLMESIKKLGVECVFMVPGGGAMYLNDALRRSGLKFVCNLHEQASAVAAEAYAKASNRPGVCLVTTGPGSTNALTGLVGAWQDSTPVIFIAGQVKQADSSRGKHLRTLGVQEVDMIPIVRSCTKHAVVIDDPKFVSDKVSQAFRELLSGRPGPIWLEVPLDIQSASIPEDTQLPSIETDNQVARDSQVEEVVQLLKAAKRPVILVGNGVKLAKAEQQCLSLVSKIQAPVLTTWASLDVVPDDHPMSMGRPGSVAPRYSNFVVQNADLILSLGARLDLVLTAYSHKKFAREAKLIVVDIDKNEINKIQRRIDQSIEADALTFIRMLLKHLESVKLPVYQDWWDKCSDWKAKYPVVEDKEHSPQVGLSVYRISQLLSDKASVDTTFVCSSSGSAIEIFIHALKLKMGQRVIHTTALGSMGFCLPSIVGAAMHDESRTLIAIDGDGGFFFNVQELATIAMLKTRVSILVLNNDGFSSIRNSQRYWFGDQTIAADRSSGLQLPSIQEVSKSFGIQACRIESMEDLLAALPNIIAPTEPKVYELIVDRDEQREPRVSSVVDNSGNLVSRPLEDMYPFLDREVLRSEMIVDLLPESI
jgi:acetolactate synthase-1/2/3 large subunit